MLSQTRTRLAPSSQAGQPAPSGSTIRRGPWTHSSACATCCLHAARRNAADAAASACARTAHTCCTQFCPGSAWSAAKTEAPWYGSYGNAGGDTGSLWMPHRLCAEWVWQSAESCTKAWAAIGLPEKADAGRTHVGKARQWVQSPQV